MFSWQWFAVDNIPENVIDFLLINCQDVLIKEDIDLLKSYKQLRLNQDFTKTLSIWTRILIWRRVQYLQFNLKQNSHLFKHIRDSGRRLVAFVQDTSQYADLYSNFNEFVCQTYVKSLKPCLIQIHNLLHDTCEQLQKLTGPHLPIPFTSRTLISQDVLDELCKDEKLNWKKLKAKFQLLRLLISESTIVIVFLICQENQDLISLLNKLIQITCESGQTIRYLSDQLKQVSDWLCLAGNRIDDADFKIKDSNVYQSEFQFRLIKSHLVNSILMIDQMLNQADKDDSLNDGINQVDKEIICIQKLIEEWRNDCKHKQITIEHQLNAKENLVKESENLPDNQDLNVDKTTQVENIPDYQVFEVTVKSESQNDANVDDYNEDLFQNKKFKFPQTLFSELIHAIEPKAREHRQRQEIAIGHILEPENDLTALKTKCKQNIDTSDNESDDNEANNWNRKRMQMKENEPQVSFGQLIAARSRQLNLMAETEEFGD